MTRIIFTDVLGKDIEVDAENGKSLMLAAVGNNIAGINADCGGHCSCATCHVYVEAAFADLVGEPGDLEDAMLDCNDNRKTHSRLSCQIEVNPTLEGLHVTVAD